MFKIAETPRLVPGHGFNTIESADSMIRMNRLVGKLHVLELRCHQVLPLLRKDAAFI